MSNPNAGTFLLKNQNKLSAQPDSWLPFPMHCIPGHWYLLSSYCWMGVGQHGRSYLLTLIDKSSSDYSEPRSIQEMGLCPFECGVARTGAQPADKKETEGAESEKCGGRMATGQNHVWLREMTFYRHRHASPTLRRDMFSIKTKAYL